NDFIALLKDSSLVSVITVVELTKQMTITAVDVRGWLAPGLLCAALYLAMSYPLARLARRLERRLSPAPPRAPSSRGGASGPAGARRTSCAASISRCAGARWWRSSGRPAAERRPFSVR